MYSKLFPLKHVFLNFTAVATFSLLSFAAAAQPQYAVTGKAYDIDTNQLLYVEMYTPISENREVTVDYAKPDGAVFATKVLIYSGEPTQPEFEYKDQRDKERLAANFNIGRLILAYDQEGYKQEKEIMETVGLVIDAGFDAYIQQEWDKLVDGKKVHFSYTLPYRLSTIKLRARQITADKSPLFNADSPASWRYFVIEPASKFVSIFSDPIHLAYESQGKYLMRYYGRSNVDSDDGGTWDVRIEYEYN